MRVAVKSFLFLLSVILLSSCATKPSLKVNTDNVEPGSQVFLMGKESKLSSGKLKLGDNFAERIKKSDIGFEFNNQVTIISIVPSVDTKVCEEQTHILGETKLDPRIRLVSISRDLPMAQQRFAKEAKLENIQYYSDYKTASFGRAFGLLIEANALLTRGVIVLDSKGVVKYQQFVSEVSELPDMHRAFAIAKALL